MRGVSEDLGPVLVPSAADDLSGSRRSVQDDEVRGFVQRFQHHSGGCAHCVVGAELGHSIEVIGGTDAV